MKTYVLVGGAAVAFGLWWYLRQRSASTSSSSGGASDSIIDSIAARIDAAAAAEKAAAAAAQQGTLGVSSGADASFLLTAESIATKVDAQWAAGVAAALTSASAFLSRFKGEQLTSSGDGSDPSMQDAPVASATRLGLNLATTTV